VVVAGRRLAQRPLGVVDLEPLAAVLDRSDALSPGLQHLGGDLRIAEPVQERDALGRPQHHIEGGDPMLAVRAAQQLPGVGWRPWKTRTNASVLAIPLLVQRSGGAAEPAAWWLAVAGQVLFAVACDLADVAVLPANRQLGDIRHHAPTHRASLAGAIAAPWCIALLP
jgi:hypothetical protein